MKGLTITTYGDAIADFYDDLHAIPSEDAVALLAELARGTAGKILELGIGTGRVALPLAARGFEVHGIDASQAMLDQLRKKPNADRVHTIVGDFCETIAGHDFSVAFIAFNTFFALMTLEDQKQCFVNVAAQLKRGGAFVLECFVPDGARFDGGQALRTGRIEVDRVILEATKHNRNDQTLDAQLVILEKTGTKLVPMHLRYAYPAELDLMAELAGMRLRERFASWAKAPFTNASMTHVSIYEKV